MRNNKRAFSLFFLVALVTVTICISFGCGDRSGQTINEPDITVEYLQGEYAEQLIRDGAEVVFGTIDVTGTVSGVQPEDSSAGAITLTQLTINAKEYVEDENYEGGYYIADRNKAYITYAGEEARTACDMGNTGTLTVTPISDFTAQDTGDRLFDVYLFDDQVLLIIERII